MAQAILDLRSARRLAIHLYGENRKLKTEIRKLRTQSKTPVEEDVLQLDVTPDERREIEETGGKRATGTPNERKKKV